MDWVGMMPGKRGSRRMVGDHILTQQDLMNGELPGRGRHRRLGDGRASAGGLRPPRPAAEHRSAPPEVYDIPLRSLYSRNIANLLMAGRNISASYVAFTSARVMATCAVDRPGRRDRRGAVRGGGPLAPRARARCEAGRAPAAASARNDQSVRGLRNDAEDLRNRRGSPPPRRPLPRRPR